MCGIRLRKRHEEYLELSKKIKAVDSGSLCGKMCDTHTFGKYAKYAAIACLHKTNRQFTADILPNCHTHAPNFNWLPCMTVIARSCEWMNYVLDICCCWRVVYGTLVGRELRHVVKVCECHQRQWRLRVWTCVFTSWTLVQCTCVFFISWSITYSRHPVLDLLRQ